MKPARLTWQEQAAACREACDSFPPVFGLRAFPRETFRVCMAASFWLADEHSAQIVVEVLGPAGAWAQFGRTDAAELRGELRPLPTNPAQVLPALTDDGITS